MMESREALKKHIVGENGISYTLGEDSLYYPDLKSPEGTDYEIGRYGRMRERYLREHQKVLYRELFLNGTLNEYLHRTDEECQQRMDLLTEQMKAKQGVTERLQSRGSDEVGWNDEQYPALCGGSGVERAGICVESGAVVKAASF